MIRKSGSPLPVGSVASQSTSACAASVRVPLQLPWPSPASGSPMSLQSEPFDLRWLTATVNRSPVAFCSNVCASDGRLFVSMKRGSISRRQRLERADRRDRRRLVDQPDLDRIRADHARVDAGIGAGAEDVVEAGHDVADRVDAGRVLELVEPDHVGVQSGQRRQQLVALARGTPAVGRSRRRGTRGSPSPRICCRAGRAGWCSAGRASRSS